MASNALRPRSVTEIVDSAFLILRAHYGEFVVCSALAYLPWLVFELLFLGDPQQWTGATWKVAAVGTIGAGINFALMSAVIVACASQAYLGEPVNVAAAVRRALPRLPRVLLANIVRYFLLVVAFFAFVFGMLYVVARLFALTPTIILEDASIPKAFGRTSALSVGRKGHILNTLGLAAIIYWDITLGVGLLAAVAGSFVVNTLAGAFATILVYPVIAITETLMYYDARIQSEGLDIERMADELGIAPLTEPVAS